MMEQSDEQTIDRLREWLRQTRSEAEAADRLGTSTEDAAGEREVGLYQLAEEFTALRHEIKLQTRSSRGLEEQLDLLLPAVRQAVEALRSVEPREAQAGWAAGRSLALALADLDEALERGRAQAERVVARLLDEPFEVLRSRLDEIESRQTWWQRRWSAGTFRQVRELVARQTSGDERRNLLAALLEGYRLIQKRLLQALASEGIVRVPTVGERVDPERMVVVDVAIDASRPPGTVVDEVRPGYMWNGRLLRCAEVRATAAPQAD